MSALFRFCYSAEVILSSLFRFCYSAEVILSSLFGFCYSAEVILFSLFGFATELSLKCSIGFEFPDPTAIGLLKEGGYL